MGRMDRVNEMIRREISNILQKELEDPRLELTSISRVETSRDLRQAKVFFTVLGGDKKIEQTLEGLGSAGNFIRKKVASRVHLKFIPQFSFFYDKTLDYRIDIENQIERLHDEL
ncbi:MAG: 30S ribosome-binding factor RbfA [Candidatus Aceula meridiana]|nr:30S ribosome-binding factor RbfA [Candidatus Aceula meridiana]